MGCSRQLYARELSEESCEANQMWCWMRCMNHTEEVNPDACAAKGLGLKCVDIWDQVWENGHGDYNPTCTNSEKPVTTPPPIAVKEDRDCSSENWAEFVGAENFKYSAELTTSKTYLLWNVVDDGAVEAKMVHRGLAGWIGVGLDLFKSSHHAPLFTTAPRPSQPR